MIFITKSDNDQSLKLDHQINGMKFQRIEIKENSISNGEDSISNGVLYEFDRI